MTASLLPAPELQFIDANGNPLAGGTLATYVPGTTTPKQAWRDAAQTVLSTNPVVLDAAGRCLLYGSGDYRCILKDAAGNLVYDQVTSSFSSDVSAAMRDVVGASSTGVALGLLGGLGSVNSIAALRANTLTGEAALMVLGYTTVGDAGKGLFTKVSSDTTSADNGGTIIVDAVSQRWYRENTSHDYFVGWFGAVGDGVTSDLAAVQSAIAAAVWAGGGAVTFGARSYQLAAGTLAVTAGSVTLRGAGQYATTLLFSSGTADCITVRGTAPTSIQGNAVRDLSITATGRTGGRTMLFSFAANWMVERVYINDVWSGIEAYVINTGTIRNVTMAGIRNASGFGVYYHAPGDGTYRSDELNLHDVVVNPLWSGAVGLLWDGWANTVNGWQFVALDVSVGIRVLNSAASSSYYPTYGEFVNSVVDGASVRGVEINGGIFYRFTGCEITNNSGSTGQGSADDIAFFIAPDTGHSETSNVSCVNCLIGNSKQTAFKSGARDTTLIGCTFSAGITTTANTYAAVVLAAPASDTIITGCKNSYFGNPNNWKYAVQMDSGTFRTLVLGCNFNLASQTAAILNNSGDGNTFANLYIGPPTTFAGPIVTFPVYAGVPSNPGKGQTVFNDVLHKLQTWDGTTWNSLW